MRLPHTTFAVFAMTKKEANRQISNDQEVHVYKFINKIKRAIQCNAHDVRSKTNILVRVS